MSRMSYLVQSDSMDIIIHPIVFFFSNCNKEAMCGFALSISILDHDSPFSREISFDVD